MTSLGMIFQYNSEQGEGLVMLSNGETKSFTTHEWKDESIEPAVGLKISYELLEDKVAIKIFAETAPIHTQNQKSEGEDDETSLTSLQACENAYLEKGFEVVKDKSNEDELCMIKRDKDKVEKLFFSFKNSTLDIKKEILQLLSMDDYSDFFKSIGYKTLPNRDNVVLDKMVFRRYVMDKHSEITLAHIENKLVVREIINGKEV